MSSRLRKKKSNERKETKEGETNKKNIIISSRKGKKIRKNAMCFFALKKSTSFFILFLLGFFFHKFQKNTRGRVSYRFYRRNIKFQYGTRDKETVITDTRETYHKIDFFIGAPTQ